MNEQTLSPEWLAIVAASDDCHTLIAQTSAAIKQGETEEAQRLLTVIGTRIDLAGLEVRGLVERLIGEDGQTLFRRIELDNESIAHKETPNARSRVYRTRRIKG